MEIATYFERSNKSSNEEASKKLRVGSFDNSVSPDVSVNNEDPFIVRLKSPQCVSILTNCMQNLEKQAGQICKIL